MLEKFRHRYEIIGSFELATCFLFGGIAFDQAEKVYHCLPPKAFTLADTGAG